MVQLDLVDLLDDWLLRIFDYALKPILVHETLFVLESLQELRLVSRLLTFDARDAAVVAIATRINFPNKRVLLLVALILVRYGKTSDGVVGLPGAMGIY